MLKEETLIQSFLQPLKAAEKVNCLNSSELDIDPSTFSICIEVQKIKSLLYSWYYAKPKRTTSGGVHLRDLAPGQQFRTNVAAVASRWRHCAVLTGPRNEPQISRTDNECAQ